MPVITIPEIGDVTFPDSMSDRDIIAAIERDILPYKDRYAPPKESGFRQLADIPLGVAKGAVAGTRMLSDVFGAENVVSQKLQTAEAYLQDLMSAQSKKDAEEVSRIMKEAQDKGVLDQVLPKRKALC